MLPSEDSSQVERLCWRCRAAPLGATHHTLIPVLQRAHHGCFIPLLLLLFLGGLLPLSEFLFVQGELDGVRSWFCPKVVHARLQTLQSESASLRAAISCRPGQQRRHALNH